MHLPLSWIVALCIIAAGGIAILAYGRIVSGKERFAWMNVWPAWPTYEQKLNADDDGTFFEKHVLEYYRRAGFPQSESTAHVPIHNAPGSRGDYGCDIVAKRAGRRYYAVECKNRENFDIKFVYGIFAGRRLRRCPSASLHFTADDASAPARFAARRLRVKLVGPGQYRASVDRLAPPEHGLATLFPRGAPRAVQQWLASGAVAAAAAALVVLSRP
ncbi:MAG: restriction endonuclease [Candidatus Tyrphobacter sp.]